MVTGTRAGLSPSGSRLSLSRARRESGRAEVVADTRGAPAAASSDRRLTATCVRVLPKPGARVGCGAVGGSQEGRGEWDNQGVTPTRCEWGWVGGRESREGGVNGTTRVCEWGGGGEGGRVKGGGVRGTSRVWEWGDGGEGGRVKGAGVSGTSRV